jgi:hypothetical protein
MIDFFTDAPLQLLDPFAPQNYADYLLCVTFILIADVIFMRLFAEEITACGSLINQLT